MNIRSEEGKLFIWKAELHDGSIIKEFNENNEQTPFDTIRNNKEVKNFGIEGENVFLSTDLETGVFNILGNKVKVELLKDDKDILDTDDRYNLTMFRTNNQIISMGGSQISDECVAYSFGYKLENDLLRARIFCTVTRDSGIKMNIDVTTKEQITGMISININDEIFAKGEGIFITNKRSVTDVRITQ